MPRSFSPILDIGTTANDINQNLDQNCYYCSVAALSNQTASQFFQRAEIMQQDTATLDEIQALFAAGGVQNVAVRAYNDDATFRGDFLNPMPNNSGVGIAYTRANNTGHMVVLAKDINGVVKCVDYQQNPPAVADFPPEANITTVNVFYINDN
ncbi:hypothetical protein ACN9M1_26600 (plasmid) [Ralstonia sp. R-29]|uniref:hypothetical protein n=1 Tax=Ralstonia sp. R-29 TaxID=3404059 RepID=UPI003CE97EC9